MKRLLAALLLMHPTAAYSGFKSGNHLLEACRTDKSSVLDYTMGVYDTFESVDRQLKADPYYCLPPGVTAGQVTDVVCKYLTDNPAERHSTGSSLTALALRDAWPCK